MKIVTNLLKDARDEWLVRTTASLNHVNPIVDRIMEDDSVEGVIMTNKEGAPIFTNMNHTAATNYGGAMQRLGIMAQHSVTEMDLFDEAFVLRLKTKKFEILVVPHHEFNIIVMQHTRSRNQIKQARTQKKEKKIN